MPRCYSPLLTLGGRCGIVGEAIDTVGGHADIIYYDGYSTVSEATNEQPWGRVDENHTVFVREGDTEREIGQYPDGTPEEALAYYERKFADLAGQVTLLEARIARGTAGGEVAEIGRAHV